MQLAEAQYRSCGFLAGLLIDWRCWGTVLGQQKKTERMKSAI